jgi:4-hydroxymandelate oxidase
VLTDAALTLGNVETLAAAHLDPAWLEYFRGGAGDEITMAENVEAYARILLRQRVLAGIDRVSTDATVLGHALRAPILVAPMGYLRNAHQDGEEAMARAAQAAGTGLCLSTYATASTAAVAAAAPEVVRFLQVYVFRDRAVTDELVAQALDDGFTGIFLTADLPVLGPRDGERRVGWALPEPEIPAVQYAYARGMTDKGLQQLDPSLDWAYLERLVAGVDVPVIVKGVLDADDARRAVAHGAAGVVVSNHGGRQLDGVQAAIDALPAIVEAVAGTAEVLVDGGVRRGRDIAIALARGARAVLVGRVALWGLAAEGEEGARTVLELLTDELATTLHLVGRRSVAEVGPEILSTIDPP